ncbi:MAG: hypothetical protein ACP5E3_06975, partial [Bacteroidales bacterium]
MRRQLDDGDIIFLANFAIDEEKQFNLELPGASDIVELDPISGKIFEVEKENKANSLAINVHLEDAGSRLYFISSSRIKSKTEERNEWKPTTEENLFISGIERHGPNVLVL